MLAGDLRWCHPSPFLGSIKKFNPRTQPLALLWLRSVRCGWPRPTRSKIKRWFSLTSNSLFSKTIQLCDRNDEKLNKQKDVCARVKGKKKCQSFSLLLTFRVYSLQVDYTIIEIETKKKQTNLSIIVQNWDNKIWKKVAGWSASHSASPSLPSSNNGRQPILTCATKH